MPFLCLLNQLLELGSYSSLINIIRRIRQVHYNVGIYIDFRGCSTKEKS